MLTGVFLICSTLAHDSNSLLGWNCAFNFMSNIMYAVLYAYTPEIFPTKDRGTGNALVASANRVFGIMVCDIRSGMKKLVEADPRWHGIGTDYCAIC